MIYYYHKNKTSYRNLFSIEKFITNSFFRLSLVPPHAKGVLYSSSAYNHVRIDTAATWPTRFQPNVCSLLVLPTLFTSLALWSLSDCAFAHSVSRNVSDVWLFSEIYFEKSRSKDFSLYQDFPCLFSICPIWTFQNFPCKNLENEFPSKSGSSVSFQMPYIRGYACHFFTQDEWPRAIEQTPLHTEIGPWNLLWSNFAFCWLRRSFDSTSTFSLIYRSLTETFDLRPFAYKFLRAIARAN